MHLIVRTNQTIRAMLSSFLLLVFLAGITPRKYWHDIFADHKDVLTSANHSDDLQVGKSGFNCGWYNHLATSPFTETEAIQLPEPLPVYQQYALSPFTSLYLSELTDQLLRGPPAIV